MWAALARLKRLRGRILAKNHENLVTKRHENRKRCGPKRIGWARKQRAKKTAPKRGRVHCDLSRRQGGVLADVSRSVLSVLSLRRWPARSSPAPASWRGKTRPSGPFECRLANALRVHARCRPVRRARATWRRHVQTICRRCRGWRVRHAPCRMRRCACFGTSISSATRACSCRESVS